MLPWWANEVLNVGFDSGSSSCYTTAHLMTSYANDSIDDLRRRGAQIVLVKKEKFSKSCALHLHEAGITCQPREPRSAELPRLEHYVILQRSKSSAAFWDRILIQIHG